MPGTKTQERYKIAQEIWKIIVDEQFSIGTVGQSPAVMGVRVASKRLGEHPGAAGERAARSEPRAARPPPTTFFFKS